MVPALGVVGGTPGWAVRGIIHVQLHARYINYYIMMKRKRDNPRNLAFFIFLHGLAGYMNADRQPHRTE